MKMNPSHVKLCWKLNQRQKKCSLFDSANMFKCALDALTTVNFISIEFPDSFLAI